MLSGFDRLVFRGTLRSVAHAAGMQHYLSRNEMLLKSFGAHVEQVSRELKAASLAEAVTTGRPIQYWHRPKSARRTSRAASLPRMASARAWCAC